MKKFFSRLASQHSFSYLFIWGAYLYAINKWENIPSFVGNVYFFFTILTLLEISYQQYLEDKAMDKKRPPFKFSIHNVDWFIVISVALVFIVLMGLFFFFISRPA